MIGRLFKGHYFSIAASVLAAVLIGAMFFGGLAWPPADEQPILSSFTVMYVLLTYLFLQLVGHVFYRAASRSQMLVDMLSSLLPVITVLYVVLDYVRGDLILSTFQFNVALLTGYVMSLDLLIDIGLTLWPQRWVGAHQ